MYKKFGKRILDFVISLIALIILSPVILITALLVRCKLGSPVIFKQKRPGKDEKIFTLYKFRSMSNSKDENGKLLPDSQRLTKFGKILRSTSLDELPELLNILKGEMSLVGPRPLSVSYLPYYNEFEKHRHDVRPGLTGLAQINGRNNLNWEDRFKYDIEYVNNITLINDIKIFFGTFLKVLKKEDVAVRGTGKTIDFSKYRKQQLEKKEKPEIGSDFWEYDNTKTDKEIEIVKNFESQYFFLSGRNVIKLFSKNIEDSNNKKILLPAYTCETVIEPFIEENFEIYYYEINKDFTINEKTLLEQIEKIKPKAIILHSYFGFNTLKNVDNILKIAKNENIIIAEDITHNVFGKFTKTQSDYYLGSLRKWFAIPDGGVLISNNKKIDVNYECDVNNDLVKVSYEAYNIKKEYIENNCDESLKEQYREKYLKAKEIISETKKLTPMSLDAKNIFNNINVEEMIRIRQSNYRYLYEKLNNKFEDILVCHKLEDDEVPLYFPIYVKTNREELQKELIKDKIYCPVIWPKSKYINEKYQDTEYIYEHILCIPCDQRYNVEDMEKIINCINKIN